MKRLRSLFALAAVATALVLVAGDFASARVGGGGSRGVRTFSPPAATRTAPNTAAPIQRTVTQPQKAPSTVGQTATSPAGGFFNRPGLLGGLAAGFLGAGLIGLLMGNGLFGGMAGFASIIGLLLQVALVILVARLAWAWWQRRNAPALAGMPRNAHSDGGRSAGGNAGGGGGGVGGGLGGAYASAAPATVPAGGEVELSKEDFDDFERLLTEIQTGYSNEDLAVLRARATPEMVSYFADDLAANASRGVVNRLSDVKLEQGDLSEAWSEEATEYATVAMRFTLVDQMADRDTGRIVEGDAAPQEAVELWTFRRDHGGKWVVSAIQNT